MLFWKLTLHHCLIPRLSSLEIILPFELTCNENTVFVNGQRSSIELHKGREAENKATLHMYISYH